MIFYTTLFTGIIIDLLTKTLTNIYLIKKINILGDYIYLQFILNPGIAFGIKIYPTILKVITISLIILIFYYYKQERKELKSNKLIDISFGLILSGAIGNAIERIFNSNVIDFIGIKYFSVFNLADTFITIGTIIYMYILYKNKK